MNPFCGAEDAEEEERGEHQRRGHIIVGLVIVECEQIHPNSKPVFTLYLALATIAIF
jgi:hypothetical protein